MLPSQSKWGIYRIEPPKTIVDALYNIKFAAKRYRNRGLGDSMIILMNEANIALMLIFIRKFCALQEWLIINIKCDIVSQSARRVV